MTRVSSTPGGAVPTGTIAVLGVGTGAERLAGLRVGDRVDVTYRPESAVDASVAITGNLVRLTSGEIAVVTQVHAPDPLRPRVRIVINREGTRLDLPQDRNLWESSRDGEQAAIIAPVEPNDYGIDPLNYLQN